MKVVPESTTVVAEITFYDENGNPIVPDSFDWYLYDKISGKLLYKDENLQTSTSTTKISINSELNNLLDENNTVEVREFVIKAKYGVSQFIGKTEYKIKNLRAM